MSLVTMATAAICAVVGLFTGTYLSVLIARVPDRENVLRPLGRCPRCGHPLRLTDMIPVLSWWRLRGRCRECGMPYGRRRYAIVEVTTAAAFGVVGLAVGPEAVLPAFLYLAAVSVALSFIDIAHHRLPDLLTLPSYPIAAVLLVLATPFTDQGPAHFRAALVGLAVLWAFYVLQWVIAPRAMSFGDVKYAGVLGLYLGWLGLPAFLLGAFAGYALAAVYGLVLIAARRATRRSHIPFGPFMAGGALVAVVASGLGLT